MENRLLPTGTVVSLKGAKKRLTIIGNSVKKDDGTFFEYIAVPHPEGFIDSETMFLFNFEDISSIDYMGFINSEFQLFSQEFAQKKAQQEAEKRTKV